MKPFTRATIPEAEIQRILSDVRKQATEEHKFGVRKSLGLPRDTPPDEVVAAYEKTLREEAAHEVYLNDVYQVSARYFTCAAFGGTPMFHLSIKRIDRQPIHDWRELQEIKNVLVGAEHEACELYPAESRVVDAANQFHLWGFMNAAQGFPFGMRGAGVGRSTNPLGKSVNREFAK